MQIAEIKIAFKNFRVYFIVFSLHVSNYICYLTLKFLRKYWQLFKDASMQPPILDWQNLIQFLSLFYDLI